MISLLRRMSIVQLCEIAFLSVGRDWSALFKVVPARKLNATRFRIHRVRCFMKSFIGLNS